MQNTHINCYIDEGISSMLRVKEAVRHFGRFAMSSSLFTIQGLPPPVHFTHHKYSTSQDSPGDGFCRSDFVVPARSLFERFVAGFFCCIEFCPRHLFPADWASVYVHLELMH